jgi:hypothetical protein
MFVLVNDNKSAHLESRTEYIREREDQSRCEALILGNVIDVYGHLQS